MAHSLLWWVCVLGAACGARELDPAACAARFDVQRDKIIRTEESRDMGARYLSELDVGARTECLRLCCETEACDVFVYEEKGPGSCYLFNCGPPEDFRCKFTAHGNFSSGVLALSRRLAELQDQERLALASLRSASSAPPPPPPPTTPRAPPTLPAPSHHTDLLLTPGRCSRYQFECRRGGECIAVYNACDGVPQCADASDEAPELGCPPPAPLPAAPSAPAHLSTPAPRPILSPLQGLQESQEGVELEAASAAAAAGGRERERWPHRLAQAQPQHRYTESGASGAVAGAPSSHIFSHKGGLLQEAEGAPPAPYPPFEPPAPAPWPRRAWTQHQNMESMGGGGWGGGAYPRLEWGEGDARRAWPVPPPRPEPPEVMYVPPKSMGEVPPAYAARANTLRDSAKKGPEPERAPPAPAAPPASAAPRHQPPPRVRTPDPPPHADKEARDSSAAARVAPPDGLSERPPAAVLLLVLGMVMTVGLGGMLGCRMSAARRRLRRGKPFAHDADYLVNGMYL